MKKLRKKSYTRISGKKMAANSRRKMVANSKRREKFKLKGKKMDDKFERNKMAMNSKENTSEIKWWDNFKNDSKFKIYFKKKAGKVF